ncbi:MAG: DUF3006 domain-containing protein [Synergistaceae bacterium]|nr:DUF3006 domain-containing protein [Synergistaceae bacterium]
MKEIHFFVDRITGGIATLLYKGGDFTATLPTEALPDGIREGAWLRTLFETDEGKKSEIAREIDSLMDELT